MAQKSLLALLQAVAAECNIPAPVSVMSNTDQNVQKMLALLRSVCDDLLMEFDWQVLQTRYSFTTVSGQDSYVLPSDRERFISGTFFDANNRWPMQGPKTPTEWEWIKASNFVGMPFTQFRVFGDKFVIAPVPGNSPYSFNFEYVSSFYVRDGNTGINKADFQQDSDICVFDHRVLINGVKLKFKESIAQDTTAVVADYKRAIEFAKGADAPASKLSLLGNRGLRLLSTANYPDSDWVV